MFTGSAYLKAVDERTATALSTIQPESFWKDFEVLSARVKELEAALEAIFFHFLPKHLDYVSTSTCGSEAKATLNTVPSEEK